MTTHDESGVRPVWQWYALAAALLLVLVILDTAGIFNAIGPAHP